MPVYLALERDFNTRGQARKDGASPAFAAAADYHRRMSETSAKPLPTVFVFCANDAARRRLGEFLRREVFAECVVAVPAPMPTVLTQDGATLRLADNSPVAADGAAADYALPLSCSDDELRTAVRLLAKVAVLRGSLTAARRSEDALQRLAQTDALTGLANRRAWDDELVQRCRVAMDRGEPLAVAILDLDEFKQVNDAHGHAVGDAVLKATAEGLRRAIRREDLAARVGGDEFGLLLPGLSQDAAAEVVERIRLAAIAAITIAGLPATTCSLGFAAEQGSAAVADRLYAAAAGALQKAKQAGRNCSAH